MSTSMRAALLMGALLSLAGCYSDADGVAVEDVTDTVQISQPLPPAGQVMHPEHGNETWFAIGPLSGTEGVPANGVAESHVFADGSSIVSVRLNIAVPPDGMFYEAWVTGPDGVPMSLGHLTNPFGDVRHQVRFEGPENLTGLVRVQVTLEKDDGNPHQGSMLVAEGTLTERKR